MSLHNVKPSTTFLIRNYFVADCVAHRSREPAKTDSMDLSPRPGTRQPLPAEIHGRNALLIALAINEGHASTTQYSATFRLAPRSVSWRCSPFNPSPPRTSTRLANELARGASLGAPSLLVKEIGLRFTNLRCNVNGFNKNGSRGCPRSSGGMRGACSSCRHKSSSNCRSASWSYSMVCSSAGSLNPSGASPRAYPTAR